MNLNYTTCEMFLTFNLKNIIQIFSFREAGGFFPQSAFWVKNGIYRSHRYPIRFSLLRPFAVFVRSRFRHDAHLFVVYSNRYRTREIYLPKRPKPFIAIINYASARVNRTAAKHFRPSSSLTRLNLLRRIIVVIGVHIIVRNSVDCRPTWSSAKSIDWRNGNPGVCSRARVDYITVNRVGSG